MPSHRYTYLILLLFMASVGACAKPRYVFQSENPIANFAKKYPAPCVIQKKAVNLQRKKFRLSWSNSIEQNT